MMSMTMQDACLPEETHFLAGKPNVNSYYLTVCFPARLGPVKKL